MSQKHINANQKRIKMTELVAPPYYEMHHALRREQYREYWLYGGRGSMKSSVISLEITQGIIRNPGSNAVIYRKTGRTIRDSVNALGLCSDKHDEQLIDGLAHQLLLLLRDNPEMLRETSSEGGYTEIC